MNSLLTWISVLVIFLFFFTILPNSLTLPFLHAEALRNSEENQDLIGKIQSDTTNIAFF